MDNQNTQNQNLNPLQPQPQVPFQQPIIQWPVQVPTENIAQNGVQVPVQTPVQTPVQVPVQSPVQTPVQVPVQTLSQSSMPTAEDQADQRLQQQMQQQSQQEQVPQQPQVQPQQQTPQIQNQTPQVNPQDVQNQMILQQLLAQQSQYKAQYESIVNFLKQNPNQTLETLQTYKAQLQQLNMAYLQIEGQLKAVWYVQQTKVNKPTTVKTGDKANFSLKKLWIGCGIFFLLLAWWFGLGINFLVDNPDSFASMGITTATAKSLLSIFAGIFFWVPLLVGLGLLISNIYKLITAKNQSKLKFLWGILLSFVIFWIFGAGIGFVFGKINEIQVEEKFNANEMITPYIVGEGDKKIPYTSKIPLIAPAQIAYQLQPNLIMTFATKNIGEVRVEGVTLHCGNTSSTGTWEQVLNYGNNGFDGYCLYSKKGTYVARIDIYYTNLLTDERLVYPVALENGTFNFISEVSLVSSATNKPLTFENGEFLVWKAPAKITVDSSQIFKDFNLQDYKVERDFDGDGTIDRENVTFDYTFKRPKVYYPTFQFPELSNFVYSFPIRVEQWDIPICDIKLINLEKTKYKIQTEFLNGSVSSIANYSYAVLDSKSKEKIYTNKDKTLDFFYTFPEIWNYYVMLDFVTVDGKEGSCESDPIQLQTEKLTFEPKFTHRIVWNRDFSPLIITGEQVNISTIPQEFHFEFESLSSSSLSVEKKVFFDNEALIDDEGIYRFKINDEEKHEFRIVVEDPEKKLKTEKTIRFIVKTPDLDCSSFTATPSQWFEPLKVTLDASKVKLKDPEDSAIYFSFDFGDGEKKENLSNGIMSHNYTYDYKKENGEYKPTVTVRSRKGLTCVQTLPFPIIVKKEIAQVELTSPSHPTQIAKVGKTISFYADFNGYPETMTRNFGDGTEEYTCKGRNCTEITHEFQEKGSYAVRLTLDFEDNQPVQKVLNFKIQ